MSRGLANPFAWAFLLAAGAGVVVGSEPGFGEPTGPQVAPTGAEGFPSRDARLNALPGFRNPPTGYGEVPFWWWTGDTLDVDRMIGQVRELHKKGMQTRYFLGATGVTLARVAAMAASRPSTNAVCQR